MGATNLTHVSNPAVAPLYLETTNILPSSKVNKTYGAMTAVMNPTDNCDEDSDEGYDSEDQEEDLSQEEEGKIAPKKKHTNIYISEELNSNGLYTEGGDRIAARGMMAVGEVVLDRNGGIQRFQSGNLRSLPADIDEDDESNINSEDDEYLEDSYAM